MRREPRSIRNARRQPSGSLPRMSRPFGRGRLERSARRFDERMPRRGPAPELASPGGAQAIELRLAVVLGKPPFRFDEAGSLEAMQRWVQRAFADRHRGARRRLDPLDDGIAVAWSPAQCLEDQQVERAASEADVDVVHEPNVRALPSPRKGSSRTATNTGE